MIRAVLVGWKDEDWRVFRQPQWMAEVRRTPEASQLPRYHFDIEEEAFRIVNDAWSDAGAGDDYRTARALLERHGAVEIVRP